MDNIIDLAMMKKQLLYFSMENKIFMEKDHYKTSTTYSGCGTENYTLTLQLDELNNSLDYFEEKFDAIYAKEEQQRKDKEEKENKEKELRERKLLEELQLKYK